MHNGSLKKMALSLTFWLALYFGSLKAQTFTAPLQASTTGTNPVDFEFRADGTLIAKGNIGVGSLLSTDQGIGTRMLWFPSLGAFRAGGLSSGGPSDWNTANIGQYSVALGYNTTASGLKSTAMGSSSTASGTDSVALGRAGATNSYAVALGGATASGSYSTAIGGGTATGPGSFSVGSSFATGGASTAMGYGTASGYGATAMGDSMAIGNWSTATNKASSATGMYSTASGYHTLATSYMSFTLGTYNLGGGTGGSWVASDPIFEIGNGTSTTASDAFVVYKNGTAAFQGVVTVGAGGDIPMYTGN